jgi:ubiquinone biosynthesis accessory factor UbiJ
VSIEIAAVGPLETALNGYLQLDPLTLRRLTPLHGRLIRWCIRSLGAEFPLYLVPHPEGLQLFPNYESDPDCTLTGTPLDFARLNWAKPGTSTLEIEGDLELGQKFVAILAGINIDWERHLARITGAPLARQVGDGVRAGERWGQRASDSVAVELKNYLQGASRLLPTRFEMQSFHAEVERLRADLARLEVQLAAGPITPNNGNTGI